jgi:hypothetical protein
VPSAWKAYCRLRCFKLLGELVLKPALRQSHYGSLKLINLGIISLALSGKAFPASLSDWCFSGSIAVPNG